MKGKLLSRGFLEFPKNHGVTLFDKSHNAVEVMSWVMH